MKGFTLIELLVTVAIIGILAGTAIPQYSQYKKRAFDSRARGDLTHVALAEEAYYLDAEKYLSCNNTNCTDLPGVAAISKGVVINIAATTGAFTGTASHPDGSGKTFHWDSEAGGLLD